MKRVHIQDKTIIKAAGNGFNAHIDGVDCCVGFGDTKEEAIRWLANVLAQCILPLRQELAVMTAERDGHLEELTHVRGRAIRAEADRDAALARVGELEAKVGELETETGFVSQVCAERDAALTGQHESFLTVVTLSAERDQLRAMLERCVSDVDERLAAANPTEALSPRELCDIIADLRVQLAAQTARVAELEEHQDEAEQLRVQLAGCGVAAQGHVNPDQLAVRGQYGWSPSYQDVVDLRIRYDNLLKRVAELEAGRAETEARAESAEALARRLAVMLSAVLEMCYWPYDAGMSREEFRALLAEPAVVALLKEGT